jgi:glutathione S-transferase
MSDIIKTLDVDAPIEKVWAALTDVRVLRVWMGDDTLKVDLKVGGRYAMFGGETTGTFTEIDAPHVLEYTWRQHTWQPDWADSLVRWQLTAAGSMATKLHLRHSIFPNNEERDSHDKGWDVYFLDPMLEYLDDDAD